MANKRSRVPDKGAHREVLSAVTRLRQPFQFLTLLTCLNPKVRATG